MLDDTFIVDESRPARHVDDAGCYDGTLPYIPCRLVGTVAEFRVHLMQPARCFTRRMRPGAPDLSHEEGPAEAFFTGSHSPP